MVTAFRSMCVRIPVAVILSVLVAVSVSCAHDTGSVKARAPVCRITAQRIRVPTAAELKLVARHASGETPENPNTVPGPDASQLVVRHDAARHPRVFLERRGAAPETLFRANATSPAWSPDRTHVAGILWHSEQRPWCLGVEELGSRDVIEADAAAHILKFKWSPDSKYVAGDGNSIATGRPILLVMDVSDGSCVVLDTLRVLSDYHFSWSPDSRFLAVSVPTAVAETEEVCAAELWIISADGKCRSLVGEASPVVARNPRWFAPLRVAVDSYRCQDAAAGPDSLRVIDLLR